VASSKPFRITDREYHAMVEAIITWENDHTGLADWEYTREVVETQKALNRLGTKAWRSLRRDT
jgi:hypothetical protein